MIEVVTSAAKLCLLCEGFEVAPSAKSSNQSSFFTIIFIITIIVIIDIITNAKFSFTSVKEIVGYKLVSNVQNFPST